MSFHDFCAVALGFSTGVIFFTLVLFFIIRRK